MASELNNTHKIETSAENVARTLYRQLRETCEANELLAAGDRVLVAMSGGKDSYSLFVLLQQYVRARVPTAELIAVHLDQRQPGYNGEPLVRWLEEHAARFEILSEDTYALVKERTPEGGTYCALCSKLRRGILYSAAQRLGCNKIALGHHRDDALETFLMNLLYSGQLQAMPARYNTDDERFTVIRPLIGCAERDIAMYAAQQAFPILPCNLCGSQEGLKRERVGELLVSLESEIPNVRRVMANALGNVHPSHLLDREVAEVWANRPKEIRPANKGVQRPIRFGGEAVKRSLPVLGNQEFEERDDSGRG